MNVPAEVRPLFDLILREPLGETSELRARVSAFRAELHRRAAAEEVDLDLETVDALARSLEELLKRISRKTTPLHHRLIHATAAFFLRGPERGGVLTDARFEGDVAVVNECVRVVRRPELHIR